MKHKTILPIFVLMTLLLSLFVSATTNTYDVSIAHISENTVKFDLNGEITNSLNEEELYKLSDASMIYVDKINYEGEEDSEVEFIIAPLMEEKINQGETKEYSINGIKYEIKVVYVSGEEAKFEVNGEITDLLTEEEVYKISGGALLIVDSVDDGEGISLHLSEGINYKLMSGASDTITITHYATTNDDEEDTPTQPTQISTTINSQQGLQDQITFEVNLNEGWNLVASGGFAHGPTIASDSQIQSSNLGAIFYYSPLQKKYLQIFPYPTTEAEKQQYSSIYDEEERLEGNYQMESRAYWVYSDKKGTLKFTTDDVLPFDQRQLRTGWNFVSITSEMLDKSLGSFKGSCDIQKFAYYDSSYKKWETSTPETLADKLPAGANIGWYDIVMFEQYQVGEGVLFKVSSDCKLGGTSGSSVTPPQIPN